jgi:hypothetical protein
VYIRFGFGGSQPLFSGVAFVTFAPASSASFLGVNFAKFAPAALYFFRVCELRGLPGRGAPFFLVETLERLAERWPLFRASELSDLAAG